MSDSYLYLCYVSVLASGIAAIFKEWPLAILFGGLTIVHVGNAICIAIREGRKP